ncbi:MAG: DUF4058 family protein [Lewinellaceae bacterium]|nr:DUF4058 family protein [Phaeodactylibacter sp.]MCB9037041.1 DUF4058 family protein [Lewinellaceae bacterium]
MPSPFPGMDPYLEGYLWPDVHNSLAYLIKVQLISRLADPYVVHLNTYTVEDTSPEEDVGIMYPDVEVFRKADVAKEPVGAYEPPVTPETIVLPAIKNIEARIPVVEIKDRKSNQLITAIEILSPVNKRKPGLLPYREKRERLHYAGVHLVEIDLLRRGERPFGHPYLPQSHYLICLLRAGIGTTQVWAVDVKDPLPVIPIPLKQPDKDSLLDLGKAFKDVYEQGAFERSVNYSEAPPPPAFTEEELEWMKELGVMAQK